jgi:hypothetical protein
MINWQLMGPPADIAGSFSQGVKMGQAFVQRRRTENALRAYLDNAGNPQYLNALAAEDPDLAYRYMKIDAGRAEAAARQQDAAFTRQVGQQYVTDPKGARDTAIASGRFDLAEQLNKLNPNDGKKLADFYKVAAPLAYKMRQMADPDQRRAFFEQAKPILAQNGADPNTLASFDPTNDTQLDAFIAQGQSVNDLISQGKVAWHPIGEAGLFATDSMGRPIGSQNPAARAAGTQSAPPPALTSETVTLGDIKAPAYAQQTSGYRTPEHNRDVGGVANSYHTKRDSAGNPLARDFVPSGGQSMAQLEADLRAANPDKDVINEGDHVHVEPSGRASRPSRPVQLATKADFDALPSGAEFIAPDGSHRRKP